MTLVDANVLLDVATNNPEWAGWSQAQLDDDAGGRGPVLICDVVYAELSAGYGAIEDVERILAEVRVVVAPIPREALFMAGKAFQRYRARGGTRTGLLPDFFIGAHAAATGMPLLTRDVPRYLTYFPTIALIAPG